MERQASRASFRVTNKGQKHRRGHKQAFRQENINMQEETQGAVSAKEQTPKGIHKLPRELTDMIWQQVGPWPTKETVEGGAVANVGKWFELYRVFIGSDGDTSNTKDAEGMISAIFTRSPPALAQVCGETRRFSLEQFGLLQDTYKAKRRLANSKRRWEREYEVPALNWVLPATHPETNSLAPWMISDCLEEDLDVSLPLDELLHYNKYQQLVIDLNDLRANSIWAPYMGGDPLGTYAHAMLDLLLSAEDGQILVAHPRPALYEQTTAIFVESSKTKAVNEWKNRSGCYIHIDDTAVWHDLQRTFGAVKATTRPPREEDNAKVRDMVRKITKGGQEARERIKDEVLKPFRDLWERLGREQATPLKPLPKMEVVVLVHVNIWPLDPPCPWSEHRWHRYVLRPRL
ncbi:hypothetical protein V8F20_011718 [Naviculisporaceae sp. PSN 640]